MIHHRVDTMEKILLKNVILEILAGHTQAAYTRSNSIPDSDIFIFSFPMNRSVPRFLATYMNERMKGSSLGKVIGEDENRAPMNNP